MILTGLSPCFEPPVGGRACERCAILRAGSCAPSTSFAQSATARRSPERRSTASSSGVTSGAWPDYQASALLMAIVLQGHDRRGNGRPHPRHGRDSGRRVDLVGAAGHQGRQAQHRWRRRQSVHRAGAAGRRVRRDRPEDVGPRASATPAGRSTSSRPFPGSAPALSLDEFLAALGEVGCAIISQTADIAPADKKLYALRDVTAHRREPAADLRLGDEQEDRRRQRRAGARREGGPRRVHEDASTRPSRWRASLVVDRRGRRAPHRGASSRAWMRPLGRTIGNALEIRECVELVTGTWTGRSRSSSSCVWRRAWCWPAAGRLGRGRGRPAGP